MRGSRPIHPHGVLGPTNTKAISTIPTTTRSTRSTLPSLTCIWISSRGPCDHVKSIVDVGVKVQNGRGTAKIFGFHILRHAPSHRLILAPAPRHDHGTDGAIQHIINCVDSAMLMLCGHSRQGLTCFNDGVLISLCSLCLRGHGPRYRAYGRAPSEFLTTYKKREISCPKPYRCLRHP